MVPATAPGGDELAALHRLLRAIDAREPEAAREWLATLLLALGRERTATIVAESNPFPRVPT